MTPETIHIWAVRQELAHPETAATMRELRLLVGQEIKAYDARLVSERYFDAYASANRIALMNQTSPLHQLAGNSPPWSSGLFGGIF